MITNGLLEDYDWRDDAACAQIGPELWFPEPGDFGNTGKMAKQICNEVCPVKDDCFEFAVSMPNMHWGIWGGKTPREIRAERSRRGIVDEVEPDEESDIA